MQLSRRDLLYSCVSLGACTGFSKLVAAPSQQTFSVSLEHVFTDCALADISPDGSRICLEDWQVSGYPLRVVEMGTWRSVFSVNLGSRSLVRDFLTDDLLYLTLPPAAGADHYIETVVKIPGGARTDRMHPFSLSESDLGHAIRDGQLLVMHFGGENKRLQWISKVDLPSYRELNRISMSIGKTDKHGAGIVISTDRRTALLNFDNAVSVVDTGDFGVRWTQPFPTDLYVRNTFTSPDGAVVAVDLTHNVVPAVSAGIRIFRGSTGEEIARLQLDGSNGFGLSADGTMLGITAIDSTTKGQIALNIHIHEIASGRRIASFSHDQIKIGRRQYLEAGVSVVFTPDGKYVITSGKSTKVWKIRV